MEEVKNVMDPLTNEELSHSLYIHLCADEWFHAVGRTSSNQKSLLLPP